MERFYINIGPKALFKVLRSFDSLRGSISYRVGGSACPFVSEPNAPAVHANLPYPQSLRLSDESHLHIAKLQWCKTVYMFLSVHKIILNLKVSYGFHIFSFHFSFLASFLSFQKKKTKISVIKIDELISCIKFEDEEIKRTIR